MELLLPGDTVITLSFDPLFTFQYGATTTDEITDFDEGLQVFTFQYGATTTY